MLSLHSPFVSFFACVCVLVCSGGEWAIGMGTLGSRLGMKEPAQEKSKHKHIGVCGRAPAAQQFLFVVCLVCTRTESDLNLVAVHAIFSAIPTTFGCANSQYH